MHVRDVEYVIVGHTEDADSVMRDVQRLIQAGWSVFGNLQASGNATHGVIYTQVMVRPLNAHARATREFGEACLWAANTKEAEELRKKHPEMMVVVDKPMFFPMNFATLTAAFLAGVVITAIISAWMP